MKNPPKRLVSCVFRLLAWLGCFVSLTCVPAARGQEPMAGSIDWRTGADLQRQLRAKVSIQWKEGELRPRLESLAADQRVAVFLDRRIDPQQKLDLIRDGLTLEQLFGEVAAAVEANRASIGPVIYLGPPPTAAALKRVVVQRRKDVGRHAALARARPRPLKWDDLAEPQQLLVELAREHGLTIVNPEAVPHDLWPAADLPPLSLAEQLTLLLAGFDLTFEISGDGRQLRLVSLSPDAQGEPVVRQPADGGPTTKQPSPDSIRYTLTVMNESAGAVVNAVAKRLDRQLQCTAEVRAKLGAKINLKVSDATLDELMDKTLTPLGLTFRLTKETIEVLEK